MNVMQMHQVKTTLAISQDAVARTCQRQAFNRAGIRTDTQQRRRMRSLLEGAGWAGAPVLCAFLKGDLTLRYMQCEVVPGADETARYVTVKDLNLSKESGRTVYRRVCLDTLVGVTATYAS